jgi:hypothetical protein
VNRRTFTTATIILSLSISLLTLTQVIDLAAANPIPAPLIRVDSPQNLQIYSSNNVFLNFTIIPNTGMNLSSFIYSIDEQAAKATDGNTILSGLPSGSHVLKIYGTSVLSHGNYAPLYNSTLAIVYFSTFYSTSWIVVTAILTVALAVSSVIVFKKRRKMVGALRGKKTFSFWLGLVCFLFFLTLVFIPSAWQMANDYLFPYYPRGLTVSFAGYGAVFGLIFMGVGLILMRLGTKKEWVPRKYRTSEEK